MNDIIFELQKNNREKIIFRLGAFKGHRFIDMRVFVVDGGENPAPTKKGLSVSPGLWPQFRQALTKVETALVGAGWLDKEDLELKMNKTDIEWTDFTWNPVTGCLHGCPYCYARGTARRFYPPGIGFSPHFWSERLSKPGRRKKPAKIFVSSMGDLFGDWVPRNWWRV